MIFFELLGLRLSPGLRIHGCCFRDPCEAPVDKFQYWWWSFWKWLLRFFLEIDRKLRCLGGANTPEYIALPQNVLMNPFFAWANEITIMTHVLQYMTSTWPMGDIPTWPTTHDWQCERWYVTEEEGPPSCCASTELTVRNLREWDLPNVDAKNLFSGVPSYEK